MEGPPGQPAPSVPAETHGFEEVLRKWHKAHGTELKIPPIFNRKDMDLLKLWNLVQASGGSREVCIRKQWATVGRQFDPPTSMTNLSFHMKRIYDKYLLSYEQDVCPARAMQCVDGERLIPARSSSTPKGGEAKIKAFGSVIHVPTRKRTQVCRPRGTQKCQKPMTHLGKRRYLENGMKVCQTQLGTREDDQDACQCGGFNDSMLDDDEKQRQELAAQALQQLSGLHASREASPEVDGVCAVALGGEKEHGNGTQAVSAAENAEAGAKARCGSQDTGDQQISAKEEERDQETGRSDTANCVWSPSEESQSRSKRLCTSLAAEEFLEEATPGVISSDRGRFSGGTFDVHRAAIASTAQPPDEVTASPPHCFPIQILPSTVMVGASKDRANRPQDEITRVTVAPEESDLVQPPSTVAMAINNNVSEPCQMAGLVEYYETQVHKMREDNASDIAELKAELEKERTASKQKDIQIQMLEASKEEITNCFCLLLERVKPMEHGGEAACPNFQSMGIPPPNSAIQRYLIPRYPARQNFSCVARPYGGRHA